jgi:flagellar hook-associated protein 3 FlgL
MTIRVNPNPLPDLLTAIQQSEQNISTAEQQLSSGLKVNQLSDNPAAASGDVLNRNQFSQDDQFLQNISTLQSRFQVADSTLSNVVTALTRAISLGTEGATGTLSTQDRQAITAEVQGIQTQVASLANTQTPSGYLFSGTAVNTQPFTLNTTTGAVTYNGNAAVASTQLSTGNSIDTNVPGSQLFQNASGSVFGSLQDLATALQSNNTTNVGNAVTEVQNALSTLDTQRVFYGNALNQINQSESFLNQDQLNLSTQQNALVAVDPATAASDLVQAETDNQAILSASGRTLSLPNLLSFLPTP